MLCYVSVRCNIEDTSIEESFFFFIPESRLILKSLEKEGSIRIRNEGGVDTTYTYGIRLIDKEGSLMGEGSGGGEVLAGEDSMISYSLPYGLVKGGYNLRLDLLDDRKDERLTTKFYLSLDGIEAEVLPKTDKPAYFYGDDVDVETLIRSLGPNISCATLKLRAYLPSLGYGIKVYPDVKNISSIKNDEGCVWFSTYDGLWRHKKGEGSWKQFNTSNSGIISNNLLSIDVDPSFVYIPHSGNKFMKNYPKSL